MSDLFEQPQLHLANPQKNYVGVLRGVKNYNSKSYLNNVSEISFRIYEYENGERNELYDDLEEIQLIEAFEVDWFQIKEVNEVKSDDIPVAYKDITCKSLEDELITKKIYALDGVYSLYNPNDVSKSIMHIATNDISWSIGRIPSSLLNTYRVLSVDSAYTYSFLTDTVSKSFDVIFMFDRYNKNIDCYTLEEIGELTDITINDQNLLKSWNKSSDKDKVVTKMRVMGSTNDSGILFDIRQVNFGSDTISNYSYYKSRMSSALQAALDNQENAYITYSSQFYSTLETLKNYNAELNTLNNQLKDIEGLIRIQEQITGASVNSETHKGLPPTSGDSDYTVYQNAITQLATLYNQKSIKQSEINNKQSQITSAQNTLDTISSNVSPENFFTPELLDELDCFTFMNEDYVDETFVETSGLTKDQVIQMKLELKANAEKDLLTKCRPQSEFKASLKNLWSIRDEKDCLISYDVWRSKFKLGNMVTIMPTEDFYVTVRIIGIEIDYDDPESAEIIFSNSTRLDDSVYILGEIQAQASRAFSSVQINKYANKVAASNTASFSNFISGTLNATYNKMVSDGKAQVEQSEYGIKIRQWDENINNYGDHGMWLNPWRMIFTDDSFRSSNTAFGLLTLPDGTERMGVSTDIVFGRLMMSENLYIENESGTYAWTNDGMTASATVGTNTYSIGINPSTPSDIFNIKVNGSNKFYVDTVNNQVVLDGKIISSSGTIGGWNIGSYGLTSPSSRIKLTGAGLNLYNSYGAYLGGVASTSSTDGGVVLVKSDAAGYFAIARTSDANPDDGMDVSLNLIYTPYAVTIGGTYYESGFHFKLTNVYLDTSSLYASGEIESGGLIKSLSEVTAPTCSFTDGYFTRLFVGIDNVLTSGNYRSYLDSVYASKFHTHGYATSNDLSNLESSIKSWVVANFVAK